MIERRDLLAAALVGAGVVLGSSADACSLTADPRVPFSAKSSKRELQRYVNLLNSGPEMSLEAIAEQADRMSLELDDNMKWNVLGERGATETQRHYLFFKEFRLSGGRLDPRPIRIAEINPIRRLTNRASYQFTLERYSYHPADPEGCNGLFTHEEYYGVDRTSYLATFWNNRLTSVKLFPEWYLEERAGNG